MWNVWMVGLWARGCGLNIQPWTFSERDGGHMHMPSPRRAARQRYRIPPFRAIAVNPRPRFPRFVRRHVTHPEETSVCSQELCWIKAAYLRFPRNTQAVFLCRMHSSSLLFVIVAEKCAFLPLMSGCSVSVYLHRDIQCLDNVLVQNIPEIKHRLSTPAAF